MTRNNLRLMAEQFIRPLRVRNQAKGTIKGKLWRLHRFLDYLEARGITHIDGITREVVSVYQVELYERINHKGRPNTVAYQNMMLAAVKQFLRFLKEQDYMVSDPSRDIPYAREPQRLPRGVLTPTEARKVLHAPDTKTIIGYRDRTILEVLYSSGIRKDEVNNLTLGDVDYGEGFLRINEGKGNKDRVVPLGRIACRYLENYINSVRPELVKDPANNTLFLSARGNRLSKNVVWKMTKKYARQAKINKNVSPHTFRHTCATAMLRNRADIRVIQELLGHSSLDSTQVYTHITITELKEIHNRCHPREKDKE